MRVLAIESSGLVASAAVAEDEILKCEFTINNKLTHSETLLPMIKEMLRISDIALGSIDAVAVSAGPGSFTGLRIGAATAKGLALAMDRPVISVSSLQVMAVPLSLMTDDIVCPIMDARRGQVYCAAFRRGETAVAESALDIHDFISKLNGLESPGKFIFLGDGVPVYRDICASVTSRPADFAGAAFNRQRASHVAQLGMHIYSGWLKENGLTAGEVSATGADAVGCFDDNVMNSDDFAPRYLRKTQAEREMAAGLLEDPGSHSLKKMQAHKTNDRDKDSKDKA